MPRLFRIAPYLRGQPTPSSSNRVRGPRLAVDSQLQCPARNVCFESRPTKRRKRNAFAYTNETWKSVLLSPFKDTSAGTSRGAAGPNPSNPPPCHYLTNWGDADVEYLQPDGAHKPKPIVVLEPSPVVVCLVLTRPSSRKPCTGRVYSADCEWW